MTDTKRDARARCYWELYRSILEDLENLRMLGQQADPTWRPWGEGADKIHLNVEHPRVRADLSDWLEEGIPMDVLFASGTLDQLNETSDGPGRPS